MFSDIPRLSLSMLVVTFAAAICSSPLIAMNDPVAGRWLTRDSLGPTDGNNLYEFASSMPVANQDPLGLWIIHRLHKRRAVAVPEPGDSAATLAFQIRFEPREYRLWMRPIADTNMHSDCPQATCMPATQFDVVPGHCIYSVPNTVVAVWGQLGVTESYYNPTSVFFWLGTNIRTEIDGFRRKGFFVQSHDNISASSVKRVLEGRDLVAFLYVGHSGEYTGDLLPRLTGETGPRVEQAFYRDTSQGPFYKLAGMKLLGCSTALLALQNRNLGIQTATWDTNVSTRGLFVGIEGSPNLWIWPFEDFVALPGLGGLHGN